MKAGCAKDNYLKVTNIVHGIPTVSGGIYEASDNYSVEVPSGLTSSIGYTSTAINLSLSELPFNPVQLCNDMLETKQNQGVSKIQVMNSDQALVRALSFSAVAACGPWHTAEKNYFEKSSTNATIKIICKSSSPVDSIKAQPKPIPAAGNKAPAYQPLVITQAQITTNKLHDSGFCPDNKSFSVGFKGYGSGQIRYSIAMGGKTVYQSPVLSYSSDEGYKQHHFNFAADLDDSKSWEVINKEFKRQFSLYIEEKDQHASQFTWSKKGKLADLSWYYTCKPKVAVPMGGQGIKSPGMVPITPSNKLVPSTQAKPVTPSKITTTTPGPMPTPQLNLQAVEPADKPARAN